MSIHNKHSYSLALAVLVFLFCLTPFYRLMASDKGYISAFKTMYGDINDDMGATDEAGDDYITGGEDSYEGVDPEVQNGDTSIGEAR